MAPLHNLEFNEEPSHHHITPSLHDRTHISSAGLAMTKDNSHRTLFFKKILVGGKRASVAARECDISKSTSRRWRLLADRTGSFLAVRKRTSIAGVMPYNVQETLLTINSQSRTSYHDELADKLFTETHRAYTRRQISQCLSRHKFVNIMASHLAPVIWSLDGIGSSRLYASAAQSP